MSPKTWFITGCSSGLGRGLAEVALEGGDRVVAMARDIRSLAPLTRLGACRIASPLTLRLRLGSVATVRRMMRRRTGRRHSPFSRNAAYLGGRHNPCNVVCGMKGKGLSPKQGRLCKSVPNIATTGIKPLGCPFGEIMALASTGVDGGEGKAKTAA